MSRLLWNEELDERPNVGNVLEPFDVLDDVLRCFDAESHRGGSPALVEFTELLVSRQRVIGMTGGMLDHNLLVRSVLERDPHHLWPDGLLIGIINEDDLDL